MSPAMRGLDRLEPQAAATFRKMVRRAQVPAGTVLFRDGSECSDFVLVAAGSIRVHKLSETGREIVLYRVEAGQSCILTTSCLLGNDAYGAEGVTETDVEMQLLPRSAFNRLLAESQVFRELVFSAYAERIGGLLMLIDEVAFGRIDIRLAGWLVGRMDGAGLIQATHQQVAVELGTAREVISRQLKDFERRGWVALRRGSIAVADQTALENLSRPA